MWYVYIITSDRYGKIYVGLTNDLRRRFAQHNSGRVFSTKPYRPFILIYYEAHHDKNDAAKREQFLKSGWGKNWIKRTLQGYLKSKKLGGLVA